MIGKMLRNLYMSLRMGIAYPELSGSTFTQKTLLPYYGPSRAGQMSDSDRANMRDTLRMKYGIQEID